MPLVIRDNKLLIGSDGKLTTNQDCCCDECVEDYCAQPMHLILCPPTDPYCYAEDYSGTTYEISCDETIGLTPSSFSGDLYRIWGGNFYLRTVSITNVRLRWNSSGLRIIGDWTWTPATGTDFGWENDKVIIVLGGLNLGECPPPSSEGTWSEAIGPRILDPDGNPSSGWSRCDDLGNCVCDGVATGIYHLGLPGENPAC